MESLEKTLRAEGRSSEEIARAMHQTRRELGIQYKNQTSSEILEQIYKRNLERYGDEIGPSIEYLRDVRGKSWNGIIKSAKTPGQEFNDLAGIK